MTNKPPESIQKIIDLSHYLVESGRLVECRNFLTEQLESQRNARLYRARGDVYMELEAYSKAIDDYSEALKLRPDSAIYFCRKGMAEVSYGNRITGISDLKKSIELDPELLISYQVLCGEHIKNDCDLDFASFCLNRMLELSGETVETKYYEGQYYFSLRNLDKSIQCYENALACCEERKDIEPEFQAMLFAGLASAYKATKEPAKLSKAVSLMSRVLEVCPEPVFYCDRANMYLLLGENQSAFDDIATAKTMNLDAKVQQYLERTEKRINKVCQIREQ